MGTGVVNATEDSLNNTDNGADETKFAELEWQPHNREINESDLNLTDVVLGHEGSTLDKKDRYAVRSVVIDDSGNVALLYIRKYVYHKLPGGGIEINEDPLQALRREVGEEVGCGIKDTRLIGTVVEHRTHYDQRQTSTAYISRVTSREDVVQGFTQLEQSQGFLLQWVPLKDAVPTVMGDIPGNYEGRFIQQRDATILQWALEAIGSS